MLTMNGNGNGSNGIITDQFKYNIIDNIDNNNNDNDNNNDDDHLFLLPERVLTMDCVQLRKDLAGLHFKLQLLCPTRSATGNVWLSDGGVNTTSNEDGTTLQLSSYKNKQGGKDASPIDREERLRIIKEKNNEERQRKLEELKLQALAAQKFREKAEDERRRRIEELRSKDNDRRHQVEERKRAIMEAEKDRKEAIIRRNQERDARMETKRKMERSSIVFAFGSSTPRMLEASETGSGYWASRRATSTTNVMCASFSAVPSTSLTRRSSERELTNGTKKRAASAGGLMDRKLIIGEGNENCNGDGSNKTSTNGFITRTAARRKTDLMPIVPSLRDTNASTSPQESASKRSSSLNLSRRSPGSRSGEVTPVRPHTAAPTNQHSNSTSQVRSRPVTAPARRPRPFSIAVTGVTADSNTKQLGRKSPMVATSEQRPPPIPSKPTHTRKSSIDKKDKRCKLPKEEKEKDASWVMSSPSPTPSPSIDADVSVTSNDNGNGNNDDHNVSVTTQVTLDASSSDDNKLDITTTVTLEHKPDESNEFNDSDIMTGSMTSSMIRRITTEGEAKAALAERRKLAREQAEREAELQRLAMEAEKRKEEERIKKEEEEQRRMEEEQLTLLEASRRAEEERLQLAIQEAQKREEEEKIRKEEELQQKLEKEEMEKKAKEEAEKQRIEMEIKLKKEEEERQARKKRVEAIMKRTRPSKGADNTPITTPTKENGDEGENITADDDFFMKSQRMDSSVECLNGSFSININNNNNNNNNDNDNDTKHNGLVHTNSNHNDHNVIEGNLLDLDITHHDRPSDLISMNDKKESTCTPTITDFLS